MPMIGTVPNLGPMRVVGVRLIVYGKDGRTLADALAPVRTGRGIDIQDSAADALKKLRESAWPPGKVTKTEVEIEVVEEVGQGRYRYKVLDKVGGQPTVCVFQCEVRAGNPVLAKTIGAFNREECLREAARA
jgi:hypothetical protein